ncbi:hypothetical protein [Sporosarcina sp. Te-1]|uniref:hypothetical protein n=1 Tax=Sporosarcina sp. Te-1 TaxID=2818390 RepID=UPI001A9F89A8|nr:hypothetical protein [Sporosarcina sp. Te-1]QTD42142.1 hypothetical protein J3U78_04785 [Sporosarcina sp. Te-1]
MEDDELEVYVSSKTFGRRMLLNDIETSFTRFKVDFSLEGYVTVKVPKREIELVETLQEEVYALIKEIEKENSVLAQRLAHRYGLVLGN